MPICYRLGNPQTVGPLQAGAADGTAPAFTYLLLKADYSVQNEFNCTGPVLLDGADYSSITQQLAAANTKIASLQNSVAGWQLKLDDSLQLPDPATCAAFWFFAISIIVPAYLVAKYSSLIAGMVKRVFR